MTMTRRLATMAAHGAAAAAYQVAKGTGGTAANGTGKAGSWLATYLGRLQLDVVLEDLAQLCWSSPGLPVEAVLRRLHEQARRPFTTLEDVPCPIRVAATVFLAVVVPLGAEAEQAERLARKAATEEAERQRQAILAARPRRRDPAAGTIFAREEGM